MTTGTNSPSPLVAAMLLYCRERDLAAARSRKALEVNELDAKAIAYIAAHPGARPSELASHLGVTSAGITTMVERLVRRSILRREADETDRRVSHIHLAVDLAHEPWSDLTRFQNVFSDIVSRLDPEIEAGFAAFLEGATRAACDEIGQSAEPRRPAA